MGGLGGSYHYRGAPVTHINSAISDPFNMLLGEKQMTVPAKVMAKQSSGYSTSAIADPFNMDHGDNTYVQHHIESARNAARMAHTSKMHTLSRGVVKALRFLK